MRYKSVIILIFTVIMNNISFSQPTGTVQMIVGYSLPMPDLKGSFGETRATFTGGGNPDSNTYFMKSGINYGIFVKLPLARKSNFNFKGGIAFNVFSNSTTYSDSIETVNIDLSQSILGITLGTEYIFMDKNSRVNPFIDGEIAVNFFSGKYTEEYLNVTNTLNLNSTIRLGIQVGGGVDFVLHNNVGALIGAKYGIANLIGKSYQANTQKDYNLNDAAYSEGGSNYPSRSITFLQFYGGVSFYFGR
jgi:hypothetical protein